MSDEIVRPKWRRGPGNRKHNRTAGDDIGDKLRQERREMVARLRHQERLTYEEIGKRVGVTKIVAHNDYREWKRSQPPSEIVEDVREQEEANLLHIQHGLEVARRKALSIARDESKDVEIRLNAMDRLARLSQSALKASEQRRLLHGADMPAQVEHSGFVDHRMTVVKVDLEEALRVGAENTRGVTARMLHSGTTHEADGENLTQ